MAPQQGLFDRACNVCRMHVASVVSQVNGWYVVTACRLV